MKIYVKIILLLVAVVLFGGRIKDDNIRTAEQMLKNGDFAKAELILRNAHDNDPNDPDVMWRLGKALNLKAETLNGIEKNNTFEEASNLISKSIKIDSKIPEAHVELARTLGYMGLFKPDWSNNTLAARIKEELDFALKVQPEYAEAYFIYGLWHRYVSQRSLLSRMPIGLGSATEAKSIESFKKACELDSENIQYKLELGRQYFLMKNDQDAQKILEKIVSKSKNLYNKFYIEAAENLLDTINKSNR